jgi:hypothetical protein
MKNEMRYCADIGMPAIDRPIPITCVHATDFCFKTCYNQKLYKLYPAMAGKDVRNEAFWQQLDGAQVDAFLDEMAEWDRMPKKRVRFMTRGEAVKDETDVPRVAQIAKWNSEIEFWMPTRAWRNDKLRDLVAAELRPIPNLRVMASTDPTTSDAEWASLKADGWSTMFYGDNDMTSTPNGDRMFRCPKTHKHMSGHCGICKAGCFKPESKGRVDVHLRRH